MLQIAARRRMAIESLETRRLLAVDAIASAHDSLQFGTSGQSMWAPGAEEVATAGFSQTIVNEAAGFSIDESVDVPNPLRIAYDVAFELCLGIGACEDALGSPPVATLPTGLDLSANFGLEFGFTGEVTAEAGSVAVDYPTEAWVEAVGITNILPGDTFTIETSEMPGAATMATDFAEVSASLSAFYDVSANIDVEATLLGATIVDVNGGFDTGPGSQELVAATVGDGALSFSILGTPVGAIDGFEQSIGFVNAAIYVPSLDTGPPSSSTFVDPEIENTLLPVSRGAGGVTDIDFAKLSLDLDALATTVAGLGSGGLSVGASAPGFSIDATLLNAELAAFFGIGQTMTFDAQLMVDLNFSKPTMVETFPGSGTFTEVTSKRVAVGQDIDVIHPGGDLAIDTVYTVGENTFSNDSDILLSPAFILDILSFTLGGSVIDTLGLGVDFCVFCDTFPIGDPIEIASITDTSFSLEGFQDMPGGSLFIPALETPELALESVDMIHENGSAVLRGLISDANDLDSFTLNIHWGDPLSPNNSQSIDLGFVPINAGGVVWNPDTREFSVDHQYLDDNPTITSQDTYTITAEVIDCTDLSSGEHHEDVLVTNVAPVLAGFASDATFEDKAAESEDVNITATFTDVGTLDSHRAVVDWGDGSPLEEVNVVQGAGFGSVNGVHAYVAGGIYTITVTLTDDDTGSDQLSTIAVVTGVGFNQGVLYIIGTSEDDEVSVNQTGNGLLKVKATFIPEDFRTFDLHEVEIDNIIAYLCEGEDHVTISNSVKLPAIIHGGADNDHLNAGGGPTVLDGGSGDDVLVGRNGRSILIGGTGLDRLTGGKENDVMIGGTIDDDQHDGDDTLLMDALTAWTSEDPYADRVLAIDLLLEVNDDGEEDKLTGSSSPDLFYDGAGDVFTDLALEDTLI